MSELIPVLQHALAESAAGRPAALCAVLRTRGSTPQSPGAMLLVRADGTTLGTLGGGCVEAEVRKRTIELLLKRQSALLDFVLDHDYGWDDGLICGGRMDIGVMTINASTDIKALQRAIETAIQRKPCHVPIRVEHDGKLCEYRVFLEVPPTLVIAGAGHVGQALARLATGLDFHVVVIDDRADFASADRFPTGVELIAGDIPATLRQMPVDNGTYVVIVTRGHQNDHRALDAVIRSPAAYLGMIGSKRKSRMILKDIAETGVAPELIDRVHTPIGLPIAAVTVPEIAVSIMAELIQSRRQNSPTLVDGPFEVACKSSH